jgi:hypothetical protein
MGSRAQESGDLLLVGRKRRGRAIFVKQKVLSFPRPAARRLRSEPQASSFGSMNAMRRAGTIQPILARAAARTLPRAAVFRPQGAALLHATRPSAEGSFHHVKHPDNRADSPFEFDEESEKEIAFTMSKYPDTLQGKQSAIMPMLWIVQQQLDKAHASIKASNPRGAMPFPKTQGGGGWVPLAAMHKVCARPLRCHAIRPLE